MNNSYFQLPITYIFPTYSVMVANSNLLIYRPLCTYWICEFGKCGSAEVETVLIHFMNLVHFKDIITDTFQR